MSILNEQGKLDEAIPAFVDVVDPRPEWSAFPTEPGERGLVVERTDEGEAWVSEVSMTLTRLAMVIPVGTTNADAEAGALEYVGLMARAGYNILRASLNHWVLTSTDTRGQKHLSVYVILLDSPGEDATDAAIPSDVAVAAVANAGVQ